MYTLKSIATRGTMLGAAFALVAAAVVPAAAVFADGLNPLTERSLLLSSSAPGFQDTDGSGNSETSLNANNATFALPGTGSNGKKSGETFTFNVSSDSTTRKVKGISFQYCTSAAGYCQAPGDNGTINGGDSRDGVYDSGDLPATADGRYTNADAHPLNKSDLDVVGTFGESTTATPAAGEFVVLVNGAATSGWTMDAVNGEDNAHSGALTGKMNYIRLANSAGVTPTPGQTVKVVFKASTSNYITNPGSGSFFVKINTYDTATTSDMVSGDASVIDGGVTVANMMTDSIHITTKVLETMDFSVGVRNKDTQSVSHGSCDPIEVIGNNRLDLGDVDAEHSLRTDKAYDAFSYWRLSSNSSGGATVYYSGNTLNNTVGDNIDEMGAEDNSHPGTEQFGLALIDPAKANPDFATNPVTTPAETFPGSFPSNWATPSQDGLVTNASYNEGDAPSISSATTANNAKFAFFETSSSVPEVIAQNNNDVIRCATSKVRYVANIAADTPAGIYTTKINYLAAPQY